MVKNKYSYFQGTEEPKPKKQQYKPDDSIVVQPRFVELFYRNYDLYDVPGKHGPGTGAYRMDKHKSVKDFIKSKRKKLKNKYKAQDSYKSEERKKRIEARMSLLNNIVKHAIDFNIDNIIKSLPILGDQGSYSDSVPIGGQLDEYLPLNDFEGKMPTQLNFGRDYQDDGELEETPVLINALSPREPELLFPNGVSPIEDLDADKTRADKNPEYGIIDSGSLAYQNMWFL